MRLLLEFMLDALAPLARWHGGDLVRGIVFLAVAQAGRPGILGLVRQGADVWPPREETPRLISVNGLAASLALPYETTRRHVQKLIAADLVARRSGDGIAVPRAVVAGAAFDAYMAEVQARMLQMMRALRGIGLDFRTLDRSDATSFVPLDTGTAPDWAVRQVTLDFMLRLVEAGTAVHENDMLRAFVFTAIMSANAEPYRSDPERAWQYATLAQSPPQLRRRPVTVRALSLRVGIPYETTRRCVAAMLKDKDIVRVGRAGLVNAQVTPRDAELHKAGLLTMSRFAQFIGDLKRLGVDFDALVAAADRAA